MRAVPSRLPARMRRASGWKATSVTMSPPRNTMSCFPDRAFKTRAVVSTLPVTTNWLAGLKAM